MERTIGCFSVPHLEIALVRLIDPSLATRPVAVVESTPTGPALRDVSAEASADGVAIGMSSRTASAFCRALVLVPHSPARVRRGRDSLWNAVAERAPRWEPANAGSVYADFTGTERLLGAGADIARRIVADLTARYGLNAAAGVGTNKLVSHLAAQLARFPSVCDVPPGHERHFVAPMAPTILPQAARPAWRPVFRVLDDLNLRTLGTIAQIAVAHLRVAVGPAATPLHRWANGLDHRDLVPVQHSRSIAFFQSLGSGTGHPRRIAEVLYRMLEALCGRLRADGRACSALRVTATYADYAEAFSVFRPDGPSQWEHELAGGIEAAVARAGARRIRIRCVSLEAHTTAAAPRQLGLPLCNRTSRQTPGTPMDRHLTGSGERTRELLSALGAIRSRFGEPAINWGGTPRLAVRA